MKHPHFVNAVIMYNYKNDTSSVIGYDLQIEDNVFTGYVNKDGKALYRKVESIVHNHLSKGNFKNYEKPTVYSCVLSSAFIVE